MTLDEGMVLINMIDAMEEQTSRSDNQNKLIPVTEKRPELGVEVLVQRSKFGEFDIGSYDGYCEREYWQNGTKHTEKVPHWWYSGGRLSDEDPIAWMPLPKLYKPKESGVEDEIKEKLDEAEDSYRYFMKKNFGIDESEG